MPRVLERSRLPWPRRQQHESLGATARPRQDPAAVGRKLQSIAFAETNRRRPVRRPEIDRRFAPALPPLVEDDGSSVVRDGVDVRLVHPGKVTLGALAGRQRDEARMPEVVVEQHAAVSRDVVEVETAGLPAHGPLATRRRDGVERELLRRPQTREPDLAAVGPPGHVSDVVPPFRKGRRLAGQVDATMVPSLWLMASRSPRGEKRTDSIS